MRKEDPAASEVKPSLREKFADAVDLSKEVLLNAVLISCIGDRELTLENYKGIIEYTDVCIRVRANPHNIKITGAGLELKNITRELLYITGRIHGVEFCQN